MEVMGAPPPGRDTLSQLRLPPGFRFYPTDEELLVQYLCRKVAGYNFSLQVIGEIDLYKFDPWVLPSKAIFGEKEWYFFSPRDRKYPNGSRPNRVAGSGYWKATGTDKVITTQGRRVGIKKALVFYVGKAPKGTKTNWIMHEYRLVESVARRPNSSSTKLDDWVLCRIYKKTSGGGGARVTDFDTGIAVTSSPMNFQQYNNNSSGISNSESSSSSHMEEVMESIPEINDDGFFSFPRIITNLKIEPQQFSSPPPQMKFPPPPVVSQPTTATMHHQHHHVPPPQSVSAMGAQKQQQQLQQEAEDNHNNSKLGLLYSFGSGSIDWNALMGLTSSGPDDLSSLGLGESGISPQQQSSILTDHDEADMCVPSLPPLCHVGDLPPQQKLSLLSDKRVQIKNNNQEEGQNGWFGGGGYLGNGGGGGQDNPFERRFDCSNQMAGLYGLRQ